MAVPRSATSTLPDTNNLSWAVTAAAWFRRKHGADALVWLVGDTWLLESPPGESATETGARLIREHMSFVVVPDAREIPLDENGQIF